MNRTLTEMARCMLIQSKLPMHFWAEAISTAAYVRNWCPTKINEEVTPFEIWFGTKPNVAHLRPFGSKAFVFDKTPGKGKFQARSTECTMIGYSSESKAYRFWNDSARKIIKSRDVKFVNTFETNEKTESIDFLNFDSEKSDESEEEKEEEVKNEDKEERRSKKEEEEAQESESEDTDGIRETPKVSMKIGPGRPSTLRTGKRGRPKKVYNLVPQKLEYAQLVVDGSEELVEDALSGPYAKEWQKAMKHEFQSLVDSGVWELTKCPKDRTPIGCRWVLKTKCNADGSVERRKARLVAKGYAQLPGIDFKETFAPVARLSSIRLVVALAAELKLDLYQLDITMAYTYGHLKEDIYMLQAEHFIEKGKEDYVYHLKRALYGLKQAGRQWYERLEEIITRIGLKGIESDPCVYYTKNGDIMLILVA